jgi:hypothetical protein
MTPPPQQPVTLKRRLMPLLPKPETSPNRPWMPPRQQSMTPPPQQRVTLKRQLIPPPPQPLEFLSRARMPPCPPLKIPISKERQRLLTIIRDYTQAKRIQ